MTVLVLPVTLPVVVPLAVSTLNTELRYWLLSAEPFTDVVVVDVTSVEVDVVVVMSVEFAEVVDGDEEGDDEGERPM